MLRQNAALATQANRYYLQGGIARAKAAASASGSYSEGGRAFIEFSDFSDFSD